MSRILIITGNYGEGHQQAANALYKAIQLRKHDTETMIIDFMEITHPVLNPISHYLFIQGIKLFPSIYGFFYRKTRAANSMSKILNKINNLSVGRLRKVIKETRPDVIVSTFPLAAGAVARLKEQGHIQVPTITVITDHTYHSSWIHDNTDRYIISSEYVKKDLVHLGIPKEKIAVTGIPIRPEFCQNLSSEALRVKHGIQPSLPVVLVMGGGVGIIGEGSTTIRALEELPDKIQLIVVCGYNDKLQKQLSKQLRHSKHHVTILGHVDYIHELMAIADLLITKPGGLTTSEAMASQLPMLLIKPLPGQEQDNAKLLVQLGVAFQADHSKEMIEILSFILFQPDLLNKMRNNAGKVHRKWAAFDALEVINEVQNNQNMKELKKG